MYFHTYIPTTDARASPMRDECAFANGKHGGAFPRDAYALLVNTRESIKINEKGKCLDWSISTKRERETSGRHFP